MIAYSVAQRTHELGVRVALGASRGDLIRLVIKNGFGLTCTGIAIGVAAAFGITRLMSAILYGVSPTDTLVFTAVPLFLVVVALLASYVPALRAARINPIEALRHE
ncbi:MAG: FtsX-like permease family protein [bacterium]|nr:FtsX-like permease family protein [bacterium]